MQQHLAELDPQDSGRVVKSYGVTVDWMPGADYSGCEVEVGDPCSGEVYKAELTMSYH